jgi:hypothetical protein
MSRKIIANRKFLEEQVRTLLEYDPEENERNPPFIEPPEQDLGNTDKLPGDEDRGAVNVDALELSDPLGPTLPLEVIIEILKTVFFGTKSSRDQVMQLFGDHYKYGSVHALANIHKSLDQVDNLTAFEAFAFRFLDLDFKPGAKLARIDLKWKSEIFKEIRSIVRRFANKIDIATTDQDRGALYREFIETAYEKVFVEYKLSDELDPVLSSPFIFGGIDPDTTEPMKITFKPTEEFIRSGLESLIKHIEEGQFPDPDDEDLPPEGVTVGSISEFLEKQLTRLTYPLSTGRNPEKEPITSFEKMRNVAVALDIMGEPSSNQDLASKNRMLAAVAIREQSAANKRFVPLAISLADVLLSLIGSASILVGMPGFGRFLATFPIRAYGWLGNKAAKVTMAQIKKRFAKAGPEMFALGMVEFTAGLSVAFSQTVGDISNRLERIQRLHEEFFSLISQAKDPDNKEYSYVEKNVDSGPYTLDNLNKTYDAIVGMISPDKDQDSKNKSKNQVPDSLRKISKEDIQKTLNKILVGSETTKLGFDLDSQAQEFLANQPFEGSSIMEAWRDIYTLMIDLHLVAVLESVKPGDKQRILSEILSESGNGMQEGYEVFMNDMEKLYRSATISDDFNKEKQEIENIHNNFSNFVKLAKEHAMKIEKDSKKVEPLLNKIIEVTMPYDITSNKQQKTNESIILEKGSKAVGGHTIKNIKAPPDAGATKDQWVEVKHTDFKKPLILTKPVADAFIKMRVAWVAGVDMTQVGKLIPSSAFRKTGDESKGNHDIGSALDLITPKGNSDKKRAFIEYVIKLGWSAGFRGFGFPQTTPCNGGNGKCNTHIDLNSKGPRWWMYDDDGKLVKGDGRWDYRDAGWFGKKILAESVVFKVLMKAIGHQTEHKKAIEEYNKEDTLSQKIERGIRRRLRSSGLNEPTKLAKKIMKTSVIMGNNVNDNINNFINKNKKDLGGVLSRTGGRVNKKYQKVKYLKIDKVLDKEYNEKNYNKKLESIEEIQDFKDLVVRYTSNFGLSSSNVTGRVSIVSKYAADMSKPNLGAFYRNKKKEFERNILSRYKQKKIAAAKNKINELSNTAVKEALGSIDYDMVLTYKMLSSEGLEDTIIGKNQAQIKKHLENPPRDEQCEDPKFKKDNQWICSTKLPYDINNFKIISTKEYQPDGKKFDLRKEFGKHFRDNIQKELDKASKRFGFKNLKIEGFKEGRSFLDIEERQVKGYIRFRIVGGKSDLQDFLKLKRSPFSAAAQKQYNDGSSSIKSSAIKDKLMKQVIVPAIADFRVFGDPPIAPITRDTTAVVHKLTPYFSKNKEFVKINIELASSDAKATEFDPRPGKDRMSNAGGPGYFDVDDAYKVHEFMKRDRLIEYIPVDTLMFTEKTIFTVTHEMPGNGFDAFSDVNPTVVEGRAPFDKAAPGQREGDRQSLIVILKRNLDVFEKFLAKLESLPRERIEIDRYSVEDYRIYKEYFESYIKLIGTGISILENRGSLGPQETIRNSYFLNLMAAAMYNL